MLLSILSDIGKKMIFEINDVKKALHSSIIEANLTPIKMPLHDIPAALLEDYFNTGMRTFFKFLREKLQSNPRDYKYIFEARNNDDPNRIRKFTVAIVLQEWNKNTVNFMLARISILSSPQISET